MNKFHKRIFKRNDNTDLFIYSREKHTEKNGQELEITLPASPHMRWNPSRYEWITY